MIHSTEPIYRIYYKSYRFLSFAKNMGKCLSKSMNRKYGQKLLDTTKTFGTDALKTALKSTIQTTAEVTGDLVGNRRRKRLQRLLQRVIMRIKKNPHTRTNKYSTGYIHTIRKETGNY